MKQRHIIVENKNSILELLEAGREFTKIYISRTAFKDEKTSKIVELATKARIPMEKVPKRTIDKISRSSYSDSILGFLIPENSYSIKELIDKVYADGDTPFFLMLNDIKYALNIGAMMRSSFAGFVNGVIAPVKKSNLINDEVLRVSMGTAERIPFVQTNLFAAIEEMKKQDIKVVAVETGGELYYDADLTGPICLIMGSEDVGISSKVMERVDKKISIPMRDGIASLNVSVTAGVIIFEKIRQEVFKYRSR